MSAAVARRYFLRAREHLRAGDDPAALEAFGAALELHPSFIEARIGHALVLQRSDARRAAQSLRAGIQRATRPTDRHALLCALGDALVAAGDLAAAEAAYNDAAALAPPSRAMNDRLARLHARNNRFADAFAALLAASRK